MNLKPLVDLREILYRQVLEGSAGTGENQNLLQCVDSMKSLERAWPPLAVLTRNIRMTLATRGTARTRALMETLQMAEDILCSQAPCEVSGSVEPLSVEWVERAEPGYPWSRISPLLSVLASPGRNQHREVLTHLQTSPELFRDWRVMNDMVHTLGSALPEMRELTRQWLRDRGPDAVHLLKNGFYSGNRKEAVLRVRMLTELAGAQENGFYLKQLPSAEGEVRVALLYALRMDSGNTQILLSLLAEKRDRKIIRWSLAKMDAPEADAYWKKVTRNTAMRYALGITGGGLCQMVARSLCDWMAPFERDPEEILDCARLEEIHRILRLIPGKEGPEMADAIRRMAELGPRMDKKQWRDLQGEFRPFRLPLPNDYSGKEETLPFSEMTGFLLERALLYNPDGDLRNLAEELRWVNNPRFTAAGVVACLLGHGAEEAFQLSSGYLLEGARRFHVPAVQILEWTMEKLEWDRRSETHAFCFQTDDPVAKEPERMVRPLPEPLDRRWFPFIMSLEESEQVIPVLFRLVPRDDPDLCAQAGAYLYRLGCRGTGLNRSLLRMLRELGWGQCAGLGVKYVQSGQMEYFALSQFLHDLPGEPALRREEYARVQAMAEEGKMQMYGGTPPAVLMRRMIYSEFKEEKT